MDKRDPPTTFGVFKPVGHTLMAFQTQEQLQAAMRTLSAHGFAATAMQHYSDEEMLRLINGELRAVGPAPNFGYELDLLHHNQVLAQDGCLFLLLHAPKDAQVETVAELMPGLQAVTAQHYGRFLIRDLTEPLPGSR
jgi:hypothetical protein